MKFVSSKILKKIMGLIPALAMFLAVQSVTSTCFFCLHQPDVPHGLK